MPAATERLEQIDLAVDQAQVSLGQGGLEVDQAALAVEQLQGIEGTGPIAAGGQLERLLAVAQRGLQGLASLLFACMGRGQGLYGAPDGDVSLCRQAFPQVPIAGVFCNGEIGPLAGTTHLHGFTASWGFLVPREPAPESSTPG